MLKSWKMLIWAPLQSFQGLPRITMVESLRVANAAVTLFNQQLDEFLFLATRTFSQKSLSWTRYFHRLICLLIYRTSALPKLHHFPFRLLQKSSKTPVEVMAKTTGHHEDSLTISTDKRRMFFFRQQYHFLLKTEPRKRNNNLGYTFISQL